MNQLRIPGGSVYVCCNHVQKNGFNPKIFAFDLSVQQVRETFEKIFAVDLTRAADWVILCADCELLRRRGKDMTPSAPWHSSVLPREVVVELRSES